MDRYDQPRHTKPPVARALGCRRQSVHRTHPHQVIDIVAPHSQTISHHRSSEGFAIFYDIVGVKEFDISFLLCRLPRLEWHWQLILSLGALLLYVLKEILAQTIAMKPFLNPAKNDTTQVETPLVPT